MKLTEITYEHHGIKTIVLLIINWKGRLGPVGFEARMDHTVSDENRWILDDEPTMVIHSITKTVDLGTISKVVITGTPVLTGMVD